MIVNYNIQNKINCFRGLAIIGVLIIHSSAPIINPKFQSPSIWIDITIIFNQISRYSVPLFFFISGFLYGNIYSEKNINYIYFIKRRFVKIIIPFIIWSIIYLILRLTTGDIESDEINFINLIKIVITGSAYGHLYFIPSIFQFYLLLPLILWISKKIFNSYIEYFYLFVLIILFSIVYEVRIVNLLSNKNDLIFLKSYWFYWWYPFAAIGILVGLGSNIIFKINKKLLFIGACIFLYIICYEYIKAFHEWPKFSDTIGNILDINQIATFLRPGAYWYALSVCFLLFRCIYSNSILEFTLISSFGKYSFGIYFLHPMINKIIIKFIKLLEVDLTHNLWSSIILFFIGSSLTYVIVAQCSKIKDSEYFFGTVR
ncbi:acyltransferase 3 [Desulfobulbus propionicus DSM 2032]|uniref:Acyltransferase 3 n=1 Tax=Desulfobulbus propionicus (strain ATCC 33891 / DSM 2032 / VKM B-1956 / 1pr3) TaxID=577650 RepID=A0A7U3YJH8_DESPD|nr:acyltransferase [Desulfobulbus propionicus]ADW16534.1 acyltransferase 3 [Desulfobulbus propionicus DSM 2032]